ncbi:hypothetical protein [Janibacter sp. G56]|uniref:hypothetical protein n=1 Tax=Janibacter sp. G56 TaxID=3418717 RepID=UPI003D058ADD
MALTSAVLLTVFGGFLVLAARGWWRADEWQRTPTLVWHLLLLPVGWTIGQGMGWVWGAPILLVAVVAALLVFATSRDDD